MRSIRLDLRCLSRHVVSIERAATGAFNPAGRQVEVLEQFTAVRACPGRIGGINKDNLTPGASSLVREILFEDGPPTVQDALAKMLVAYQVADFQIFTGNQLVVLYQVGTPFTQIVLLLVSNLLMLTLHFQARLATVLAALFLTGKGGLHNTQFGLRFPVEIWVFNLPAVAGRDEGCYPYIHTNRLSCCRQRRFVGSFTDKTGIPLPRLMDNANGLDVAFYRSVPAHRHTADAELLEGEAVEAVATLEARVARFLARLHAPRKKALNALSRSSASVCRVWENTVLAWGLAITDSHFFLLGLADAAAFKLIAQLPIFQAHIVEVSADRKGIEHALLLCRRRIQAIPEGSQSHVYKPFCAALSASIIVDSLTYFDNLSNRCFWLKPARFHPLPLKRRGFLAG
jgi:hypothetical protein